MHLIASFFGFLFFGGFFWAECSLPSFCYWLGTIDYRCSLGKWHIAVYEGPKATLLEDISPVKLGSQIL